MADERWELTALVSFMKAEKVTKVRLGGMEVELSPSAFPQPPVDTESIKKADDATPSEEEFMRWSAQGAFVEQEDVLEANQ